MRSPSTCPTRRPSASRPGCTSTSTCPDDCDERALVHAARRQGVRLEGAARHWADSAAAPPALVIGYGMAAEPAIEQGIQALATAYATTVRGAPATNGAG